MTKSDPTTNTPDAEPPPKSGPNAEPTPQTKAELKPDSAVKPCVDAEAKPADKATTSSDVTRQISKRAYELYEKGGRQSDHAVQDWEQAKPEIANNEIKAEPEPQAQVQPGSEPKAKPPSDLTAQLVE